MQTRDLSSFGVLSEAAIEGTAKAVRTMVEWEQTYRKG